MCEISSELTQQIISICLNLSRKRILMQSFKTCKQSIQRKYNQLLAWNCYNTQLSSRCEREQEQYLLPGPTARSCKSLLGHCSQPTPQQHSQNHSFPRMDVTLPFERTTSLSLSGVMYPTQSHCFSSTGWSIEGLQYLRWILKEQEAT